MRKLLAAASLALLLATGGADAQAPAFRSAAPTTAAPTTAAPTTAAPTTAAPATPAPTTPAPTTPTARPSARATLPAGAKVNLNTATAAQLDALPGVGKARLKVIMTERAKSPFKDWSDFDQRTEHTSINAGVKQKIKDMVVF